MPYSYDDPVNKASFDAQSFIRDPDLSHDLRDTLIVMTEGLRYWHEKAEEFENEASEWESEYDDKRQEVDDLEETLGEVRDELEEQNARVSNLEYELEQAEVAAEEPSEPPCNCDVCRGIRKL